MDMDFAVSCPLVRRWRLVSGSCPSTRTFAPCFFQTPPRGGSPCIITRPSPPSGWPEDFHLQAAEHAQHTTKPLARRPTGSRVIRSRIGCWVTGGVCDQATAMPARRARASRLRRHTIRSYIQIVDAFRQHTGARLDRITPSQLRRYNGRFGTATPRNCASCSPSRSATAPPRRGAPSGRISSDGNCGSR